MNDRTEKLKEDLRLLDGVISPACTFLINTGRGLTANTLRTHFMAVSSGIRELLSARSSETQWCRDMSLAPKDGTEIVVLGCPHTRLGLALLFWDTDDEWSDWHQASIRTAEGWVTDDQDQQFIDWEPTAWALASTILPAPPVGDTLGDEKS